MMIFENRIHSTISKIVFIHYNKTMLKINNLHVSINGKEIIKGLNLQVNAGEVHAIMGPNGTGKSTLASIIAGKARTYLYQSLYYSTVFGNHS